MSITANNRDEWPAFNAFQKARAGWEVMNESPTQKTKTYGVLYEADTAPAFIEVGAADVSILDFTFGCLITGEPAVRCRQTGRVWVGSFQALIALAVNDGIGL